MKKKKILFITHSASRTGAPILLLNLAGLIKQLASSKYQIIFMIKGPGYSLIDKFQEYTCYKVRKTNWIYRVLKKLAIIKSPYYFSSSLISSAIKDVDVIISNTITNGELLSVIRKKFKGKIVSYIHELQMSANLLGGGVQVTSVINNTDIFIVPSMAVRDYLMSEFYISEQRISHLPYYIPPSRLNKEVGIGKPFMVGASGTLEWRKGPDIFVVIAKRVFKICPDANIIFVWKGATGGLELDRLNYDINKSELNERVLFKLSDYNMNDFFNELNVFVMTSREDPYPLVVLEAANAAVPCISFDRAGGAIEFINSSKGGKCVEYLDIDSMAEAILYYYNNPQIAVNDGILAKNSLMSLHQNDELILTKFEQLIED